MLGNQSSQWITSRAGIFIAVIAIHALLLVGFCYTLSPSLKTLSSHTPPVPLPMMVNLIEVPGVSKVGSQTSDISHTRKTALSVKTVLKPTTAPKAITYPKTETKHSNTTKMPKMENIGIRHPQPVMANVSSAVAFPLKKETGFNNNSVSGHNEDSGNARSASGSAFNQAPASGVTSSSVSGLSTAPSFGAAYLNNPAPQYPSSARRRGEQGRVLLRVLVTAEGRAKQVDLHASSGSELLDDAAVKAVRKWRFVPAKQGVTAVEAWVQVPIAFKLDS